MTRGDRPPKPPEMSWAVYCYRLSHGLALDGYRKRGSLRFSGRCYRNPPEKIAALREKYKDGVTAEILAEFEEDLFSGG